MEKIGEFLNSQIFKYWLILMYPGQRSTRFNVSRDVVRNNLAVTNKHRLSKGSQIRAEKMYAITNFSTGIATVYMPYTGIIDITLAGSPAAGKVLFIKNPFITGNPDVPVKLIKSTNPNAGINIILDPDSPGEVGGFLTGSPAYQDIFTISVGKQT